MNILIYIPVLDQSWGGVRQYSVGLLRILANDDTNKYFIYHNSSDPEIMQILSETKQFFLVTDKDVVSSALFRRVDRSKQIFNFISRRIYNRNQFEVLNTIDRLVVYYKIDVIHCPYQFVPDTVKAKLVFTLHDVQELHFPGFFTAEGRAYRATHFLDYLRRADRTIVSYNHVKQDLIDYFAVKPASVDVILLDMGRLWFEKWLEQDSIAQDIDISGIPAEYLFYPANTWQHKNHTRLLKALALLRNVDKRIVNVVFSGHLTPFYEKEILPLIDELKLHDQVKFIGVVDEQVLFALYKKCIGVVVPTLYEAGSFPLMESMLIGVPVICSNVTSLPETVGAEQFTFNPFDIQDIANKVSLIWESEEFRSTSISNSVLMSPRMRSVGALNNFISTYSKCFDVS